MIKAVQPGDLLDHYRIDRLVANGGMASVFQGTDTRTGRTVAIKVPKPELECDVLFFDRFHREAEIGRKLDHPGVVKVMPNDDPIRVYMVLQWVEGKSLREILDQSKKLSPERAGRIALRICDALGYIHSHGVVHRDLKPDNIMVDEQDRIKLIDFGIAGQVGARRLTFAKFTKSMGTPDYVSPEQVKGKRGDARSDIYSLGVMLYEMLTGEVPFRGPNPLVALNQRLVTAVPDVREVDPQISPELQEIIHRALEREPVNRYSNVTEFAHDLQHPEQIGARERSDRSSSRAQARTGRLSWRYMVLALIPLLILALMIVVARQR
jgi:eukaryotic-like serine/threonine-protein kinase